MSTPKRQTGKHHEFTDSISVGRRTPETLTLLSYLQPITSLDEHSVETLETLLKLVVDFRKATSQTPRIQRGSPNAHALGNTIATFRPRMLNILGDVKQVFAENEHFPGMYLLRAQFAAFQERFDGNFNDGGNEAGYSERVKLLEKLMYLNGTLRGHIEMILEQHGYWKAKLAGQVPPKTVRRSLDFNQEADVSQVGIANTGFGFSLQAHQQPRQVDLFGQSQPLQFGVVVNPTSVVGSQISPQRDTPKTSPQLKPDSEAISGEKQNYN